MSRSAMLLRLAMEPLTAGSILAVCDCCPALHPLTAAAAISTHTAAAARPRGTEEFTILWSPSYAGSATASDLVGEDVQLADGGGRGEQLVGLLREGLSNLAAKMCLSRRLVGESVDNAEYRRTEPNRKPWFRA